MKDPFIVNAFLSVSKEEKVDAEERVSIQGQTS